MQGSVMVGRCCCFPNIGIDCSDCVLRSMGLFRKIIYSLVARIFAVLFCVRLRFYACEMKRGEEGAKLCGNFVPHGESVNDVKY